MQQRGERERIPSPNLTSSPMDLSNYQPNGIKKQTVLRGSNRDRKTHFVDNEDDELTRGETEGVVGALTMDEENSEECGDVDNKTSTSAAAKCLSVVRPEVLFGENNSNSATSGSPTSSPGLSIPPYSQSSHFDGGIFPPSLMPLLGIPSVAARSSSTSAAAVQPSTDAMKEAFQEVLKLYGVPSDLAEAIAKNAQNAQCKNTLYIFFY